MTYSALDIAVHIIRYCDKKGYIINNFALQKILYFCQAYFLINNKTRCFYEPIIKTRFGICVPEVYKHFKFYGSGALWTQQTKNIHIKPDENKPMNFYTYEYSEKSIKKQDKKEIEAVVDNFKNWSNPALNELTFHQDPWNNTNYDQEITCESICEYFIAE